MEFFFNPNGVAARSSSAQVQPRWGWKTRGARTQGSLADSATAGLEAGIPLGFTEAPIPFSHASTLKYFIRSLCALLLLTASLQAQTLLNIDFGVGTHSAKSGFAATGQATNDFWNLYRHYEPKFLPGMKLVHNGELKSLKLSDGTETKFSIAVTNAPGVWGNASGDPMFDTYLFAQNGSNITVAIHGLDAGRYHLYLYGHADPDVTGEQNSLFNIRSGTNELGPLTATSVNGWKASSPWQERHQYVVFRDVPVVASQPLFIDVAPGPNGIAVLNGLQLISRGTSPPRLVTTPVSKTPSALTNLLVHEVRYTGKVSDSEARFEVTLDVESLTTNEISRALFDGDVAVLANEIPAGLRIVSSARQYRLICATPGRYQLKLEIVAKIARAEPWNQVRFNGPVAAIASVSASAASSGVEMQLLSGTQINPDTKATSRVEGFLGSERELALRWQSKTTEIARKSLVTVDTVASAQVTPTVIKFHTQLRYNILQAPVTKLTLQVPAGHTLTKVQGDQIRDWSVKTEGERQLLSIEFVKPVEKTYTLTLLSEQLVEGSPATAQLVAPQPLDIERESGSFTLSAEDMVVEVDSVTGLRQVNAAADTLAAYRFYGRPFTLAAKLRRIEPVLKVADRVGVRLEETRLLVQHALTLNVEKSGIYAVELTPQPGFVVADVRGEGVEDWKTADGKLRVSFAAKVLGTRRLDVQLEQALKTFPDQIALAPLRVTGATNETAQIGASSAPGIRLKTTGELAGLREVPVTTLQRVAGILPAGAESAGGTPAARYDESLAYTADAGDWALALAAERLPARVVADVFNLATIGDGLVGGSAVVRYGIINQGVQEFRVKLPAHWKNVEFTGPNIRRKETNAPVVAAGSVADTNSVFWTIALQDKAWGGYTLVITYDYQFDAKKASLNFAGAHALGVERETGSVALTTAGSLQLKPQPIAEPLRLIDQTELAETDRALITRPVLLAYRYAGDQFALNADVVRNQEVQNLLNAVADRTQITSVLTEEGQMLSQASFMVKNNDKQFQKFRLPTGSNLWGCYVNNQPVKAEQDGEWLLVSLPRDANRDQAFAVDIVYKQTLAAVNAGVIPKSLELSAPKTDVPNTYAEWQLYVPTSQRLSSFAGSMTVQRGTTYDFRDAWNRFTTYYGEVFRDYGAGIIVFGGGGLFFIALIGAAIRSGKTGAVTVLVTFAILAILAGMMLPALSKAKSKAQRVSSVSSLKQIALAARMFANDNGENLPATFDDLKLHLGTDKVLIDPATGERFIYVGAGKKSDNPQAIIAYSPVDIGGRNVAFADGSVQQMSSAQFAEALQRDAELGRQVQSVTVAGDQLDALARQQVQAGAPMVAFKMVAPGQQPAKPASGPVDSKSGFMLGAVGGVGVAASPATALPISQRPPTSTGIRSIRIDIPRTGQMFSFTKVLNVSDEPLSVQMSVMKLKAFQVIRSACQLAFFLTGLFIVWREWTRAPRRSFRLTVGTAFVIGAVCALGLSLRALHFWFIAGFPLALGIAFVWALMKFWPRTAKKSVSDPVISESPLPPEPTGPATVPPAVATLALLLTLALGFTTRIQAQESDDSALRVPHSALTNSVSIVSATYTGTVREKVAQFDVTLVLSSIATNQTIALFGAEVAVQEFKTDAREAKLVRQGKGVAVRLADKGTATLRLKLVAKPGGDATKRALEFAIPPALASKLSVSIDELEAEVEFPTAIAFQRVTNQNETRVEAILGAGDRVELSWMPRMKRIGEMAASIFAQSTTLVTVAGGAVNTRSVIDYQVSQGELRQVKLTLPAGQRLLRVEGEWIRIWELSDEAGAQLLTVDLVKGIAQGYRLAVEMEKVLDKLPTQVRVEVPQVQDVIRENGLVALRGGEELSLSIEGAADLQRVDAGEFARSGAFKADGVVSAFRFLKHGFALTARAEAIQPQVEAVARNSFHVGFEQLTLTARVDYTIKKAGVFTLRLALPEGYKVESVNGNGIAQWNEKTDTRTLEVNLKERTLGSYQLAVTLAKTQKELPKTIDLAGATPVEVQKLTGFVSVTSEAGVAVRTTTFDGLTEIPAAVLGEGKPSGGGSVLAYKFIGTDPATAGAWKLALATETVESWVRAEVVNLVSLSETLVSGRALVRYDIQNAPVKEFRLRVPTNFANVEINGADIRRRDQTNDIWRVELQNKVRGSYTLVVTWDETRATKTNRTAADALNFTGVQALGVERETGSVVLLAKPPLQVTEATAAEPLVRIDVRELPAWAGVAAGANAAGEVPVLVYRYLRPGYALGVEVKRFDEAAVLQALVDNARFTTVVADDGQMMTEMALNIRNNGLQHLRVELPKDASVWSAFVAGQPVRPSKEGDVLLLPLERSTSDDAPIAVELIYVGRQIFPKSKGDVKLESPKLDVPLKNARWDLYLPPDYDYTKFAGSMTHEIAAEPVVQVYSSSDYYRQEQEKKVAKKSEMLSFLSSARRSLSEGRLKGANEEFNNAVRLNRDEGDEVALREVEELKKDLSKIQSSNLIQAQRAYTEGNIRRYAGKEAANAPAEKELKQLTDQVAYDSEVAEQQWGVLQRAQEVTVAKVQPLRANLPTRGQRHSFSQVLQTEVGKEMTIRFAAANTKHIGWFKQTIYFAGAFLALWILVSLVAGRDHRPRHVTA